jgi:hypothetical protein
LLSDLALYLVVGIACEAPIVVLLYPGRRVRMAACCAVSTGTTQALLFFRLPIRFATWHGQLLFGEALAVVLEGTVYCIAARREGIGRALVASGLANMASFILGTLLLRFLS